MDRLNQIRSEAGSSKDSTLDTSLAPSEAYLTANESESSKFFSLSEVDSTFSISPTKESASATTDADETIAEPKLISNLSPIAKSNDISSFKIGKHIEAANILSGGVNIFEDNSYDGDELVIDDNACKDDTEASKEIPERLHKLEENSPVSLDVADVIPSKDTEVVLQIDGKNVDAIDIGNDLYLYRQAGGEELAAVQILDDNQSQQPSFKFLKVRENAEGNLEVYEEIEIEVPKELPKKKSMSAGEELCKIPKDTHSATIFKSDASEKDVTCVENNAFKEKGTETQKESIDTKSEVNVNGKTMKLSESRKSPLINTFTPMTYHSTPNKEGIPLTKTMVNQQLQPSRHSENVKKTIEVHINNSKQKLVETLKCPKIEVLKEETKNADLPQSSKAKLVEDNSSINFNEGINDKKCVKQPDGISKISDIIVIKPEFLNETNNKVCNDSPNLQPVSIQPPEKLSSLTAIETDNLKASKPCLQSLSTAKVVPKEISVETTDRHNDCDSSKVCLIESVKENNNYTSQSITTISLPIEPSKKDSIQLSFQNIGSKDVCIEVPIKKCVNSHILQPILIKENENCSSQTTYKNIDCEVKEVCIVDPVKECDNSVISQPLSNIVVPKTVSPQSTIKNDCKAEVICTIEPVKECTNKLCLTPLSNEPLKKDLSQTADKNNDCESKMCKIDPGKECNNSPILNVLSIEVPNVCSQTTTNSNDCKARQKWIGAPADKNSLIIQTSEMEASEKSPSPKSTEKSECKADGDAYTGMLSYDIVKCIEEIKCDMPLDLKSGSIKSYEVKEINKNPAKMATELKNEIDAVHENKNSSSNVSSNKAQVPFGKWTEANRQEFLNKIKEPKITASVPNTNQLKQPHDLNRRDVLKKIDSQRQTSNSHLLKVQQLKISTNSTPSTASAFTKVESQPKTTNSLPQKSSNSDNKKMIPNTNLTDIKENKLENQSPPTKHKNVLRKEVSRIYNNQDLIDITIEDRINRGLPKVTHGDTKNVKDGITKDNVPSLSSVTLDDIERKMNELHGIPFVERPVHELPLSIDSKPSTSKAEAGSDKKQTLAPFTNSKPSTSKAEAGSDTKQTLAPFTNKSHTLKNVGSDSLSDDEIIEHEPITGDMVLLPKEKSGETPSQNTNLVKKDTIITEKDFDKFARRNSITYENCITVNFEKRDPRNDNQTIVGLDVPVKKLSRNELMLAESKAKSSLKQQNMRQINQLNKIPTAVRHSNEVNTNKNYQSKVQIAYQSALTEKRQHEIPISIIEDKPVKVVFMDSTIKYPLELNKIQGQDLSPCKKSVIESENATLSASESLDSDTLEGSLESKISQEEVKVKTKHQRKQVLTPVIESADMQLIEPGDLGIDVKSKKKRKIDDKNDKGKLLVVPKKSYLLSRNNDGKLCKIQNIVKNSEEPVIRNDAYIVHSDPFYAIDNLVKAAELIETQSENKDIKVETHVNIPQTSPPKRGRGRPRKYPVPEKEEKSNLIPSPQKKIKIMDEKRVRSDSESEISSGDEIVKENWTMGKINENIVCPICSKLFRSENVVFKHVKHCTGPSPNRSDSDKLSPRKVRSSREFRRLSMGSQSDLESEDENLASNICLSPPSDNVKEKIYDGLKDREVNKVIKTNMKPINHVCELCGRTFRQLSYLLSHKLQHHNKKSNDESVNTSVFNCEVCQKTFRKLHHLVQHRIIHNPRMTSRLSRKSSIENNDSKIHKSDTSLRKTEDHSAGFRCEPCDKSFRKLHHLVEHRETHDGINNKKTAALNVPPDVNKQNVHQCKKCSLTFKKLQHLIEHKDQHLETSSDKSDDKSVQSSLSTKDIIHECSICYMVFPNEHSLNKHAYACQRKKKQSIIKNSKQKLSNETESDSEEASAVAAMSTEKSQSAILKENPDESLKHRDTEDKELKANLNDDKIESKTEIMGQSTVDSDSKSDDDLPLVCAKVVKPLADKTTYETNCIGLKHKLKDEIITITDTPTPKKKFIEIITIPDTPVPKKEPIEIQSTENSPTPKKKSVKEIMEVIVTKKLKSSNVRLPADDTKTVTESSDDDEIRYMLNPDYKPEESVKEKFMKVQSQRCNSLFSPILKDLNKSNSKHTSKLPRLKSKQIDTKTTKNLQKDIIMKDSDKDIKYSFPKKTLEKTGLNYDKKVVKKSLCEKRKSLNGIAKRKSLGKQKIETPQNIRKRKEIEYRCDCGQLFSSDALLSRHTVLAHTPPRRRKHRSPPPDKPKPIAQPKPSAQNVTTLQKSKIGAETRKSNVNNSNAKKIVNTTKTTRRSTANKAPALTDNEKIKKFIDRPNK
ncbi:unnamed protein product [Leptidea sinapis]|uniref:C2H2-type domain-containing protein n=1 Tax=Leptidea sinapis TaxID=189913 RepID=A0A5E4QSJ7_9NEOP|nr:unnamed protein product [Leptidea sinapis]